MSHIHRRRSAPLRPLRQHFAAATHRRTLLKGLAVAPALGALSACEGGRADSQAARAQPPVAPRAEQPSFLHGVASGDPLADRVVLWTRVTPAADGSATLDVLWEIATDADFSAVVGAGVYTTSAARDYTVKVDPTGLAPATTYYYRFACNGVQSVVGRSRTAPREATERLRFAVCACNNYTFGYFNGFGAIARRRDLDAVIHLGDYIYEYGDADDVTGRTHAPAREIVTLADYRERHAQYKQDPDLAEAHRQHPFITTWDDHETTNNSYRDGAQNHQPDTEGDWIVRKGQAVRAYFEWMPIRDNADSRFDGPEQGLLPEGNGRTYRRLAYGDLVDLILLDTRLAGRVEQNGTTTVTPEQTILGEEQRAWLIDALSEAPRAQWTVLAQQMTFAPIKVVPLPAENGGTFLNSDAWDGYRFDRQLLLDTIEEAGRDNVVILSGDTHVVTAFDVPKEPSDPTRYNPVTGEGSLAVEFSSNGIANVGIIGEFFMANNPHLKYSNLVAQGYLLLDIDRERAQGEYYFTGLPFVRDASEVFARALAARSGSNRLDATTLLPAAAREDAPALAPDATSPRA